MVNLMTNGELIVEFLNLLFGGILAGIEIVVHYGLQAPTELLAEQPQIQLRQALIRRLRWLVPAVFIPTALSGCVLTILAAYTPGFIFRYAGIISITIWILVRIIGTVRINQATLAWQADAPPKDWMAQIKKSEQFHAIGVWAAVSAFIFFLLAIFLRSY